MKTGFSAILCGVSSGEMKYQKKIITKVSVKQIQINERVQLFKQNIMLLCYNISQFIFHCQDVEFQF